MAYLPPPKQVSGLIKLARYSVLFLGITWGDWRQRSLTRRAERVREIVEQQEEIRQAKKAIYKNYLNREEMLYLSDQADMPLDEDFDEQYPPPDTAKLRHLCDLEEDYVSEFIHEEGIRFPLEEPCEKLPEIESIYPDKKRSFGGFLGLPAEHPESPSESPPESSSAPCSECGRECGECSSG